MSKKAKLLINVSNPSVCIASHCGTTPRRLLLNWWKTVISNKYGCTSCSSLGMKICFQGVWVRVHACLSPSWVEQSTPLASVKVRGWQILFTVKSTPTLPQHTADRHYVRE